MGYPFRNWLFTGTAFARVMPAVTVRVPDLSATTYHPSYVWAFK